MLGVMWVLGVMGAWGKCAWVSLIICGSASSHRPPASFFPRPGNDTHRARPCPMTRSPSPGAE